MRAGKGRKLKKIQRNHQFLSMVPPHLQTDFVTQTFALILGLLFNAQLKNFGASSRSSLLDFGSEIVLIRFQLLLVIGGL